MIPRLAAVLLCGMMALACGSPQPQGTEPAGTPPFQATPDTLRDQVLAVIEQYYADFSARDWPRYAEYFWPDARLTTIWQPPGEPADRVVATSIAEFIAQAPQGPGSREVFEEKMTSAEALGFGDLAVVWAHYSARFGDPGEVREWTGIDAFTLLRHDGRWRIAALAYVTDGPGAR
jgi:ketosteroid isomerase-like protein